MRTDPKFLSRLALVIGLVGLGIVCVMRLVQFESDRVNWLIVGIGGAMMILSLLAGVIAWNEIPGKLSVILVVAALAASGVLTVIQSKNLPPPGQNKPADEKPGNPGNPGQRTAPMPMPSPSNP